MEVSYSVGIDLGTTYCCAAVLRHSSKTPEIIPNEVGGNTTPSFVAYDEEGDVYAGSTAKDLAVENPESTVFDVKRLIGRSFYDAHIQKYMKLWPFQLVNIDGLVGVKVGDRSILPQTVAQELLSHLRNISQTFLHCPIESAVVTIPAYFTEIQKGLTRDACYRAGLKEVEFITEPQAAAYAYGLQSSLPQGKSKLGLIFDLGGGTFDVTIFKIFSDNKVEIKATGGDARLGGEDFNDLLMEYCIKDFQKKNGIDLTAGKNSEDALTRRKTAKALRRLRNDCEKKKIHLSTTKKVVVSVDALYNGIDFALAITRTDFENLIDSHLSLASIDKVLKKSKLRKERIEDVVLIGGSSRIPKVEQVVSEYFGGIRLHRDINPDEAVAGGAAVYAYNVFQAKEPLEAVSVVNMNEHTAVYTSHEESFLTSPSNTVAKDKALISSTPNPKFENHFQNLFWIRDLIMKHKAYFLPKTDELATWLENFQKLNEGFRHNPKASEHAFELRLSALLDTSTLQDLAGILFEKREDQDAGELYQKIHNRLKATVGEDHINAIKVQVLIARSFYRYDYEFHEYTHDYEQIFKNACKIISKVLGESHPDTLQTQYYTAWSLWYNNEGSEALEIAEKVYSAQKSAFGSESSEALQTQVLISRCFHRLKRMDNAEALTIAMFEKQHLFLKSSDSDTLEIKFRLSSALRSLGKYKESLSLAEDVYEAIKKSLTPGHIVMLSTQRLIGLCCIRLKKYEEGIAILTLVLEGRKKILGFDHKFTLLSQYDISWAMSLSGRKSEALLLYREVYARQVQLLGPNHKDTLLTKRRLDHHINAGTK